MNDRKPDILIPSEFARLLDNDWSEAAVYGGRNSLKSHTVARILLIRAMQAKTRIFCGRELQNSLADSSHQLLSDLIELYGLSMFKVTDTGIVNTLNGSDFLFKGIRHNTQSIKSIEGIDLAWIEEAQTVTSESIEVLAPTVRKPGAQIIWTYNRLTDLDPIHQRLVVEGRPNTIVINVNYDVAMKYGWMSDKLIAEMEYDRDNNPSLYAHKWLGEPVSQVEDAIIARGDILAAMQREVSDEGAVEVGVDVARFGSDRSEFVMRRGLKEVARETHEKLSITDLADKLKAFVDQDKSVLIKIDDTGVGGGLTDIMAADGYRVMPINFGAAASDPDKYPNLISEAWFYLASIIGQVQLTMDRELLTELASRKWVMDSKGRRGVESKDAYKKRGYRSPDKADATILCFYTANIGSFDYEPSGDMDDDDHGIYTSGLLDATF